MIERTSAPKLSGAGSRSSIFPARLMSLAIAGSRRATNRVPFAISSGVAKRPLLPLPLTPDPSPWGERVPLPPPPWFSGELGHELRELVSAQPELAFLEVLERPLRDALGGHEVVHRRVDIEQAGYQVTLGAALLDDTDRGAAVSGVVVFAQVLEHDVGFVVEPDVADGAGFVVHVDLLEEGDERDVRDRLLVVFDPAVALGRTVVVVERDARRDDVEHRRSAMGDRRLDQRHDLLAVAAERPHDERTSKSKGHRARVDRLERVDGALLLHRAEVGGRRELRSEERRVG